jgi:Fe-S cluster assembly protein SufD
MDAKSSLLRARAGFEARLPGRGLAYVDALRTSALARFETLGLPTARDEDWKYTSLRALDRWNFASGLPPPECPAVAVPALPAALRAWRIVFQDGEFAPTLSDLAGLPDGVILEPLATALEKRAGEIEAELGRYAPANGHGFLALNTSLLSGGAYLRLGPGLKLERPIEILHVATGGNPAPAYLPRTLILAESQSAATIIERFTGAQDGAYLTDAVTELAVRPGAHLEHVRLQEEGAQAWHVGGLYLHLGRDAHVISHNLMLGAALARLDLRAVLAGEGAHCELNGLYLAGDHQHLDNHTHIEHEKPHGTSRERYRGVLDGRARAVFHGRIVVRPGAQKTDAQQENRNLLLSREAEVDTKPQLEIYADDVKCAHGATVGQLDPDALFYLRSRGMDEAGARGLLTVAFAKEVIEAIRLAPLRERLEKMVMDRLHLGSS